MDQNAIHINRSVKEKPQQYSFTMHAHKNNEILFILSGDADYMVEGNRYHLQRGDLILMRTGESHHLVLRSDARYERYVLNFDPAILKKLDPNEKLLSSFNDRSLGQLNLYRFSTFPNNQWQIYLERMCHMETDQEKLFYLLPLLNDLKDCFSVLKSTQEETPLDRSAVILQYINQHLSEPLSLDILCEKFYISKTHLNRIFRQATGSSVWEYITVKRLFKARTQILNGETPTKVYPECGFQDYSTFYRAYKQHFGISPKKELK